MQENRERDTPHRRRQQRPHRPLTLRVPLPPTCLLTPAPQEKQDESEDAEVLVKIFVEFKESISAKKAKNGLDGRFFAGKTISAIIYDQVLFDQQDYSY